MKGRSTVEIGLVVPWLTHTLTQAPGQRSVEEIVEDIRSKASRSLASSVPPGFPKNHTFTMGVLVDGAPPQLILISNFESLMAPPQHTAKNELFVSNRYLMLIRLFQLTTRCSVGSVSSVLSQDSSPVSDSVRRRRGLPRVPGRAPLVRGLQVPPMRARSAVTHCWD